MDGHTSTRARTLNLVLLGPPGAGKGTQAQTLVDGFGLTQLSTGDMLRAAKTSGTALGQRVAAVMARGDLVTDDIVVGLIEERLTSVDSNGVIFDGFPRTLAQADALDRLLARSGQSLDVVIELQVEDAVLVERILTRADKARAAGQPVRADDTAETLAARLEAYHAQTAPLVAYYKDKGVLVGINAMGGIDQIAGKLAAIVKTATA